MESWSYALEGKGPLFSEEMDLPTDTLARSRKMLMGWDMKSPCNFENIELGSDKQTFGSMGFMELGFHDMIRRPISSDPDMGFFGGEMGADSSKGVASPTCMVSSNSFFGEEESGSRHSNSVIESSSQDSFAIDLQLGNLGDGEHAKNVKFSNERSALSSVSPTLPAKRARTTSLCSQTAFCQVHGCNKDLSSSKDYHKRHKVCDVHSKTPKVIVNGIEQRFCQQCSRFHLLSEFDDGKRSCRKRLAGHNERRRKPQLYTHSVNRFLGTYLPKRTSIVLPDVLHSAVLCPNRYEQASLYRHFKLEEPFYKPQLEVPNTNRQLLPKSSFHLHDVGKQYGSASSGNEGDTLFDTASTVQELSGALTSNCALSLLSAHSQNLSSHLTGIPVVSPQIIPGSHGHYIVGQNSNKQFALSTLGNFTSNGFHSSKMNSIQVEHMGSIMLPDAGYAADLRVHTDGIFQRSNFLNAKYCLSPEHGTTVDLLQLSSHLQRVERQRNFMQVKPENEDLCCFPTT